MTIIKSKVVKSMVKHTESPETETIKPNIVTHENFYPIDLLTASLGSCITLYTSENAKKNNIEIKSISSEISREMENSKVSIFNIILTIEGEYSDNQKLFIENKAKNCPVANSLSSDIKRNFTFNYI
jgi:putative redox protein